MVDLVKKLSGEPVLDIEPTPPPNFSHVQELIDIYYRMVDVDQSLEPADEINNTLSYLFAKGLHLATTRFAKPPQDMLAPDAHLFMGLVNRIIFLGDEPQTPEKTNEGLDNLERQFKANPPVLFEFMIVAAFARLVFSRLTHKNLNLNFELPVNGHTIRPFDEFKKHWTNILVSKK